MGKTTLGHGRKSIRPRMTIVLLLKGKIILGVKPLNPGLVLIILGVDY